MTSSRRMKALTAIAFILIGAPCFSQEILLDDFSSDTLSDSWIRLDTNVTEEGPKAWGPGNFDVSTGALNLRTTGVVPATPGVFDPVNGGFLAVGWGPSAVDPVFANGTVRTKIRIDSAVAASVNLRSDLTTFSSYNFNFDADTGTFAIIRFENAVGTPLGAIPDLSPGQGEDWWVEASSIGNLHALKVWPVGDLEPAMPQLTVEDDMFTEGLIGLGAGLGAGDMDVMVNATFDDVAFIVPEPRSASFGILVFLIGVARCRRHREKAHV